MPGRTSDRRGAVPSVGMLDCERLWNVRDVSTFLGIPVSTLHQWRYLGTEPPAFRVGKHLLRPGDGAPVAGGTLPPTGERLSRWPATWPAGRPAGGGPATGTPPARSTPGTSPARPTPSGGWRPPRRRWPAASGSTRPAPGSPWPSGRRCGWRPRATSSPGPRIATTACSGSGCCPGGNGCRWSRSRTPMSSPGWPGCAPKSARRTPGTRSRCSTRSSSWRSATARWPGTRPRASANPGSPAPNSGSSATPKSPGSRTSAHRRTTCWSSCSPSPGCGSARSPGYGSGTSTSLVAG